MGSKKRPLSVEKEIKGHLVALGFVLNYDRTQLGLTVKEVARLARIEPERLDAIEAGNDERLDLLLLARLSLILSAHAGAFLKAAEPDISKIRGKSRTGDIAKKPRKRATRSRAGTRRSGK